jgi:hypothetical protein
MVVLSVVGCRLSVVGCRLSVLGSGFWFFDKLRMKVSGEVLSDLYLGDMIWKCGNQTPPSTARNGAKMKR